GQRSISATGSGGTTDPLWDDVLLVLSKTINFTRFNRELTWASTVVNAGDEIIFPGSVTTAIITGVNSADLAFAADFCIELFGVIFDTNTDVHGLISFYNASGNQRSWALDFNGTASPNKQ